MNTSFLHFSKSALVFIVFAMLLVSCEKDDEMPGPAGAASKPFNLVMGSIKTTVAYNIAVSADGSKVFAGINNETNPEGYYSQDGGNTFTAATRSVRYVNHISNQGAIQTSDGKMYTSNGTQITTHGNFGNTIVMGDNGKIFGFSWNDGILQYITTTDATIKPITPPVAVDNSAGTYSIIRAKGKGIVLIHSPGTKADKTIKAYVLDETTMTWSSHSAPITWSKINGCNNLSMYERFSYGMNNTLIMKGCTGTAILNLTAGTTSYVEYPKIENVIPETLRDGDVTIDTKGTLYLTAGAAYAAQNVYVFKDNKWSNLDGFLQNAPAFSLDASGNIFYNAIKVEGTIMKSPVKVNLTSGTRKALELPRLQTPIIEAAALDNEVIFVADLQLWKYTIASNSLTSFDMKGISDFNVLSDGRWAAGGNDNLFISSDQGSTWTETKKIFSSADANKGPLMNVLTTRIVNGQVLVWGVYTYSYYNAALGVNQTKRDNLVVTLTGGKQNYQFPSDFAGSGVGPDGALYGFSDFVGGFGAATRDVYEVKPGSAARMLDKTFSPTPQIVEDGLQMTISSGTANSSNAYMIHTRKTADEKWTAVGTDLPGDNLNFEWLKIRSFGNSITFISYSEVYKASN